MYRLAIKSLLPYKDRGRLGGRSRPYRRRDRGGKSTLPQCARVYQRRATAPIFTSSLGCHRSTPRGEPPASDCPSEPVGFLHWPVQAADDIFLRHFIAIVSITSDTSRKGWKDDLQKADGKDFTVWAGLGNHTLCGGSRWLVSVSPSASSNSRQASSPASEAMVAPWNSNRIRRSKRSLARELVLSPIGCLQSGHVIKN